MTVEGVIKIVHGLLKGKQNIAQSRSLVEQMLFFEFITEKLYCPLYGITLDGGGKTLQYNLGCINYSLLPYS